jgi:hypothetical protein
MRAAAARTLPARRPREQLADGDVPARGIGVRLLLDACRACAGCDMVRLRAVARGPRHSRVHVRAARARHARAELGVAEPREDGRDAADEEREHDRGADRLADDAREHVCGEGLRGERAVARAATTTTTTKDAHTPAPSVAPTPSAVSEKKPSVRCSSDGDVSSTLRRRSFAMKRILGVTRVVENASN